MSQYFEVHPDNPQPRLLRQAAAIISEGGVIAYPTDSGYCLGYALGNKAAQERVVQIRQLPKDHQFTLMCCDLSDIASFAKVENWQYRLLKAHTPGRYTFLLPATREVPRRLQHIKRKTIGLRVPDHNVSLALLDTLQEPLMSSTLIMPGDTLAMHDAYDIKQALGKRLDLVIDAGSCPPEPTSIIDLTEDPPVVVRHGGGDTRWLED